MSFFEELKRRNVFRVGAAYVVGAWIVLQLLDVLGDILELPPWGGKLILVLLVLGFFLALFFAWAYELTPEGVKPEREVDRGRSITRETGQRLDRTIIVLLVLVVAWFLFDEFYLEPLEDERSGQATTAAPGAPAGAEGAEPTAIAVLPFDDLSQAQDQGWFADGLAEEILNSLTRIPELQVSSRTASFRYRDSELPPGQIARELGVGYLLEGSVRSSDDRIRVTAQLIRTADGFNLWSESYDRDASGLISIQEDLARSIAEALEISLDPEIVTEMSAAGTQSIEAYQAYLRGIALHGAPSTRPRAEVLLEVRGLFEQAVAADPAFGEAWYRLADWWLQDLTLTNVFSSVSQVPVAVATEEFNRVINQAIEHAANRVDRDGYRAMKAEVAGRLRDAVELYAAYVAARPNTVLGWDGLMNAAMKASDTANLRRAFGWLRENGRKDLRSATVYLAFAYQHEDPSRVADYGLERLEQWPDHPGITYQVHRTMLWAGRTEEAAALARRLDDAFPNKPLLLLRQACAEGRTADAEEIFEQRLTEGDAAQRWLALKILGRDREATNAVAEMAGSEFPQQFTTPLIYRIFDPTPFPAVMELLDRENILRPPPAEIPFRCPAPDKPSVAVLAFDNMSPDPENEYFADGVSEEILNLLAGLKDLRVIARTSAFSFKSSDATVAEIAAKLNVAYVLEGSVRKAGNRVRVTAQLIETGTESHLWSETFDRELVDIFAVQGEIAAAVVNALKLTLPGINLPERKTATEAYTLYLEGLYFRYQFTTEGLAKAVEKYQAALAIDPDYVPALVQLANTFILQSNTGTRPFDSGFEQGRQTILRALEIDPSNATGWGGLGYIEAYYDWNWDKAARSMSRMRELDSGGATSLNLAATFANMQGQFERSLELRNQAIQRDPLQGTFQVSRAFTLMTLGRHRDAVDTLRETLQLFPEFYAARRLLGKALLLDGQPTAALAILDETGHSAAQAAWRAMALHSLGRETEAMEAIEDGLQGSTSGREVYLAQYHAWRGDQDTALDYLERAVELRWRLLAYVVGEPVFFPLHEDPRWEAILERIGLLDAWRQVPAKYGGPVD